MDEVTILQLAVICLFVNMLIDGFRIGRLEKRVLDK